MTRQEGVTPPSLRNLLCPTPCERSCASSLAESRAGQQHAYPAACLPACAFVAC